VTSPGLDLEQITGLPTWMWLEAGAREEHIARADISGFWVEVTAHPHRVVWDMGDGSGSVACDGPGTPYDPGGGDRQRSDCTHVYQNVSVGESGGVYRASVTIEWTVDWTSSVGQGGTLANVWRTTTFDVAVGQRQAVIERNG
jgi:hypothetical protein